MNKNHPLITHFLPTHSSTQMPLNPLHFTCYLYVFALMCNLVELLMYALVVYTPSCTSHAQPASLIDMNVLFDPIAGIEQKPNG